MPLTDLELKLESRSKHVAPAKDISVPNGHGSKARTPSEHLNPN